MNTPSEEKLRTVGQGETTRSKPSQEKLRIVEQVHYQRRNLQPKESLALKEKQTIFRGIYYLRRSTKSEKKHNNT